MTSRRPPLGGCYTVSTSYAVQGGRTEPDGTTNALRWPPQARLAPTAAACGRVSLETILAGSGATHPTGLVPFEQGKSLPGSPTGDPLRRSEPQ